MSDARVDLLRHALATLAYRGGKAVRGASPRFASFRVGEAGRTPLAILAHIGDLLDWACELVEGRQTWKEAAPVSWEAEVARFHEGLARLDARLAEGATGAGPERLFQGPVADALTHVGQIAMLRRLAGEPMRGENYYKADIATGRVGADQAAPRREFD